MGSLSARSAVVKEKVRGPFRLDGRAPDCEAPPRPESVLSDHFSIGSAAQTRKCPEPHGPSPPGSLSHF